MLAGIWNAAGSTVTGALKSIGNVWSNITSSIGGFNASNFFPASQKTVIKSAVVAPVAASPNPGYRSGISPQAVSLAENWVTTPPTTVFTPSAFKTAAAAGEGWVSSPNTGLFGVDTGSQGLTTTINNVLAGMSDAAGAVGTFKSLADSIIGAFTKGKPTSEGPAEIGNSRGVVTDINPTADMSSSVGTYLTGVNSTLSEMVKGLFNLGYSGPQGAQPTVAVQGEAAKTQPDYTMLIIIAMTIAVVYLFLRHK